MNAQTSNCCRLDIYIETIRPGEAPGEDFDRFIALKLLPEGLARDPQALVTHAPIFNLPFIRL